MGDLTPPRDQTPPRGRRPGHPDTRGTIIDVARRHFLSAGYTEVTLRRVADDAGVDVALVGYYFGSKRNLFLEAMADVRAPAVRAAEVIATSDLASLPVDLFRRIILAWDAESGSGLRAIAAAAAHQPEIRELYARAAETGFITQLRERIGGPDASGRAAAYALQLSGLVYSRYLLGLEPIASLPAEELIRLLGPALTLTLLGPDT